MNDTKSDLESSPLSSDLTVLPPLFELFELSPRLNRLLDLRFRTLEPPITFGQYRTLRRVEEGYRTLTAIQGVGTLSLPALSERIDGLVRKRLIRRRQSPKDRRSALLSLTEEGRRILEEGHELLTQLSDNLLREMTPSEVDKVTANAHTIAIAVAKALASAD